MCDVCVDKGNSAKSSWLGACVRGGAHASLVRMRCLLSVCLPSANIYMCDSTFSSSYILNFVEPNTEPYSEHRLLFKQQQQLSPSKESGKNQIYLYSSLWHWIVAGLSRLKESRGRRRIKGKKDEGKIGNKYIFLVNAQWNGRWCTTCAFVWANIEKVD